MNPLNTPMQHGTPRLQSKLDQVLCTFISNTPNLYIVSIPTALALFVYFSLTSVFQRFAIIASIVFREFPL